MIIIILIREKSPTIYNSKCRLVAIRRLRVITCMIEVTTKIPRLLQSVHTSTMMSLICREALLQKGIYFKISLFQN